MPTTKNIDKSHNICLNHEPDIDLSNPSLILFQNFFKQFKTISYLTCKYTKILTSYFYLLTSFIITSIAPTPNLDIDAILFDVFS